MFRATIAAALLILSGCTSEVIKPITVAKPVDSMIGKHVLVTDSGVNLSGYPIRGKILTVDPNKDKPVWMPEYVPSFKAIVVGEIGERIIDGEPYPPVWQVRPEEGPAAFIVVEIVKAETVLTVLK